MKDRKVRFQEIWLTKKKKKITYLLDDVHYGVLALVLRVVIPWNVDEVDVGEHDPETRRCHAEVGHVCARLSPRVLPSGRTTGQVDQDWLIGRTNGRLLMLVPRTDAISVDYEGDLARLLRLLQEEVFPVLHLKCLRGCDFDGGRCRESLL